MLKRAHVTRSHQTAHQPPHLRLVHGLLEVGSADRRIAEPSGRCHRPLRGGRTLEERYLKIGGHSRWRLFALLGPTVLLVEPLYASGCVDKLLLTRIERVAGRAYLDFDLRHG